MLISRSEPSKQEEVQLSFKYGTLLANNDLKPLLLLTTKEPMELFWCMTSLTDNLSKILKTGLLKSTSMETKTLSNFWSAINLISNLTDKSRLRKERLSLNLLVLSSWKHQPRKPTMSRRHLLLFQMKSSLRFKADPMLEVRPLKEESLELLLEKLTKNPNQAAADPYNSLSN